MGKRGRRLPALGMALGILATSASLGAQETYYLGESTDFTGNGCPEVTDLNDITTYFQGRVLADGWTGTQFLNSQCWPQDFKETSWAPMRFDDVLGDARTLVAYAGHGCAGGNCLGFGFPHAAQCQVSIGTEMALGRLAGDRAAHVMYFTSCTLNLVPPAPVSADVALYANEVRQQYGFHDSPTIQSGAGGGTFDCTATRPNSECWIDVTEHRFEFWFGYNSPIVFSFGQTLAQAAATRDNCKLKAGLCNSPAPEPWWYFVWNMRDAGSGPCF